MKTIQIIFFLLNSIIMNAGVIHCNHGCSGGVCTHLYEETDDCTFFTIDGRTGDWKFYGLRDEAKGGQKLMCEQSAASSFVIPISELCYEWFDLKSFMMENRHIYYKGMLQYSENGAVKDSMLLTFNLLPSRPIFVSGKMTDFVYDWEWDTFDCTFNLYFKSERCDRILMGYSDDSYTYRPDELFIRTLCFYPVSEVNGDTLQAVIDDRIFEWGQYMVFDAVNKYGHTHGVDTLFSNDYVEDENVRAWLDSIVHSTSVRELDIDDIQMSYKDGRVFINAEEDMVEFCSIYDCAGKKLFEEKSCNSFNMSGLDSGIYIIRWRMKDRQVFQYKILK